MSSDSHISFAQVIDAVRHKHGWQLANQIGQGGFAQVYKELIRGVPRAVKIPFFPLASSGKEKQRELQALEVARRVAGHPRLVGLIHYEVLGGYLVTVWEWADGGSLAELLQRHRQDGQQGIPLEDLLRYMLEAAEGIDYLNQKQGVYHRDIKPENLLLFQGHVKLADLGLAKIAGASTASHTGAGTWGYTPPEARLGHKLSPTVDLYGLAATYVKLRTGREPFGTDVAEILSRQREGRPLLNGLGPKEAEVVRAALAAQPEDRAQRGAGPWVRSLVHAVQADSGKPARPQAAREEDKGLIGQGVGGRTRGAIVGAIVGAIDAAIDVALGGALIAGILGAVAGAIAGGIGGAIVVGIGGGIVGTIGGAIAGAVAGARVRAIGEAFARAVAVTINRATRGAIGRALQQAFARAMPAAIDVASVAAILGGIGGGLVGAIDRGVLASSHQRIVGAIDGAIVGATVLAIVGGIGGAIAGAIGGAIGKAIGWAVFGAIVGGTAGAIVGAIDAAIDRAIVGPIVQSIDGAIVGAIALGMVAGIAGAIAQAIGGGRGQVMESAMASAIYCAGLGGIGGALVAANLDVPDRAIWWGFAGGIIGGILGSIISAKTAHQ